jgi:hypothetical protein
MCDNLIYNFFINLSTSCNFFFIIILIKYIYYKNYNLYNYFKEIGLFVSCNKLIMLFFIYIFSVFIKYKILLLISGICYISIELDINTLKEFFIKNRVVICRFNFAKIRFNGLSKLFVLVYKEYNNTYIKETNIRSSINSDNESSQQNYRGRRRRGVFEIEQGEPSRRRRRLNDSSVNPLNDDLANHSDDDLINIQISQITYNRESSYTGEVQRIGAQIAEAILGRPLMAIPRNTVQTDTTTQAVSTNLNIQNDTINAQTTTRRITRANARIIEQTSSNIPFSVDNNTQSSINNSIQSDINNPITSIDNTMQPDISNTVQSSVNNSPEIIDSTVLPSVEVGSPPISISSSSSSDSGITFLETRTLTNPNQGNINDRPILLNPELPRPAGIIRRDNILHTNVPVSQTVAHSIFGSDNIGTRSRPLTPRISLPEPTTTIASHQLPRPVEAFSVFNNNNQAPNNYNQAPVYNQVSAFNRNQYHQNLPLNRFDYNNNPRQAAPHNYTQAPAFNEHQAGPLAINNQRFNGPNINHQPVVNNPAPINTHIILPPITAPAAPPSPIERVMGSGQNYRIMWSDPNRISANRESSNRRVLNLGYTETVFTCCNHRVPGTFGLPIGIITNNRPPCPNYNCNEYQ